MSNETSTMETPTSDPEEHIINLIKSAFDGVERGEITLHEAEVIDSYGTVAEREAARRRDTDARWSDVSDAAVERCPNALNHLDAASWRYYLPRYMVWTLENHERSRSISADHTLYALLLTDDRALNDHLRARYNLLDDAQSRSVAAFLRYMAGQERSVDAHAAATALDKTWARYEAPTPAAHSR